MVPTFLASFVEVWVMMNVTVPSLAKVAAAEYFSSLADVGRVSAVQLVPSRVKAFGSGLPGFFGSGFCGLGLGLGSFLSFLHDAAPRVSPAMSSIGRNFFMFLFVLN